MTPGPVKQHLNRRDACTALVAGALPLFAATVAAAPKFAKPKVATINYSGAMRTSSGQAMAARGELARYDLVILGLRSWVTVAQASAVFLDLKAKNPAIRIAQYSNLLEVAIAEGGPTADQVKVIDAQDAAGRGWWLRSASGDFASHGKYAGVRYVNATRFADPDERGWRWPETLAQNDYTRIFAGTPGGEGQRMVDYLFSDSVDFVRPPAPGFNWKRSKSPATNQDGNDAEVVAAQRAAFAAYHNRLRELQPGLKVMVNAPLAHVESPELRGGFDGAFLEAAMGLRYSSKSWPLLMDRYRRTLAACRGPRDVVFQAVGTATNYRRMRFGLCSALLDDGWFMYSLASDDEAGPKSVAIYTQQAPWFDEYDAPIGEPTQASPTQAAASGVWSRAYENGLVVANPNPSESRTVTVPRGYKHLSGQQDPEVNSGRVVDAPFTLPPSDGVVLLRAS